MVHIKQANAKYVFSQFKRKIPKMIIFYIEFAIFLKRLLKPHVEQHITDIFSMYPLLFQYDVVPIQPSVVICSCSHPSMVRNHPDSCSPLAIPGASSSHCPSMEGSEARGVGASASSQGSDLRAQPAVQAPQPRKKKPEDFRFGKILGEGSFSTVCNLHSS